MYYKEMILLEKMVEKFVYNFVILFEIKDCGYICKGYKVDLVLVDINVLWIVNKENILYYCGWLFFEGIIFRLCVCYIFINGVLVFENGKFLNRIYGE